MNRGQKSYQGMSSQPAAIQSPRTTRLLTNSYRLQTLATIEVVMYDIQVEPQIEGEAILRVVPAAAQGQASGERQHHGDGAPPPHGRQFGVRFDARKRWSASSMLS